MEPDFSGWATKAGLKCSDGRTITPEAFKHQDKMTVPLVWQHGHSSADNVLGHAILEARDKGVYAYGFFNETPQGQNAKALVQHGDINQLSIYANQLVERSKQVFHGVIREVSLVLSGANPGALIDFVAVQHSDGSTDVLDEEAVIYTGLELEHDSFASDDDEEELLEHAAANGMTVQDVFDAMTPEQQQVVQYMIGAAVEDATSGAPAQHAAVGNDPTVQEIYDSLTEEQKNVVNYLIGAALEANSAPAQHSSIDDDNDLSHQDQDQEGSTMPRNVFEGRDNQPTATLSHDQLHTIVEDAKKLGSFKESMLKHAVDYGIENIDMLFPDAKTVLSAPELASRRMEWVSKVMDGAKKSPFSRIKTVSGDITLDTARAKGYVKGTLKKEEWFSLSKRITTPTTIYKKQKLDRDDIVDITDLDVVAWLKGEMRLMLDEEIARAILLGDGRAVDDDDKINEQNIRPIAKDDDFFAHKVTLPANVNNEALVEAVVRARPYYRGSGMPTLFCTETLLTDMLLSKDKMGRRLYNNQEDLQIALRVGDIQTVDAMEDQSVDGGDLMAVVVNMNDYTIGADSGGAVAMFDDFDIDYNQYKYLMETRISGALTKFKSALVFNRAAGTMVNPEVPAFDTTTGVLTIPTQAGVIYTNAADNSVFSTGAQPAIAAGQTVEVVADPASGYYFPYNTDNDWTFTRSL